MQPVSAHYVPAYIKRCDHITPDQSDRLAAMFLEIIMLASHVLKNNAAQRSEQLHGALLLLMHQTAGMDIPDLVSGFSDPEAEVQFLAVQKERFVKTANGAK